MRVRREMFIIWSHPHRLYNQPSTFCAATRRIYEGSLFTTMDSILCAG